MASFSFTRQSQPAAPSSNDPLQPLRAMADRVGKEVEKFAERVDNWHVHGNESARTKYQTTVKLVGKFRDVAETQVKELKRAHDAEHKGELARSVRRRVQDMAEATEVNAQSAFGQSCRSTTPSLPSREPAQLHELRQWQAELATWELARIMIDQHYSEPETYPAAAKRERLVSVGGNKRYSPNSEIWDRFVLEDDHAKEKALVLRWLEQTARNDRSNIDSITEELETQSGRLAEVWTNGWLETKGRIKQSKRLGAVEGPVKPNQATIMTSDKSQNLITQLDPDAPTRQKRVLEKSDEYCERALWMVCYEMLRRGLPWSQICEWAQERNEAWRCVSVGAAYESHPNGGPNVAGPTVGYLFRRVCFYAARGARLPYEGAVYGLLSGDLKQAQLVCRTWDDHLHAYYNALLLSRFDTYLQKDYPNRVNQKLAQQFVFQDAVANIGGWEDASQRVIDFLSKQKPTASEAHEPYKLIQGALIAKTVPQLVLKVGTALAEMFEKDVRTVNLMLHPDCDHTDPTPEPIPGKEKLYTAEAHHHALAKDPHALRILVHIFITFNNGLHSQEMAEMGRDIAKWIAMDNVIAAYIEFLRISHRIQPIPLYAAQLAPERGAHCLARILPDIKNTEEQRKYVALLEQYRIDVVQAISQCFIFAFDHSGFTHFEGSKQVITDPITRFVFLEKTGSKPLEDMLFPGYRIRPDFDDTDISPKEEAIIEALQWYHHIDSDYKQTFRHLKSALTIFLLKGRLAAAERVIDDLSVEVLSLSRTEAFCGYPFDFTQPDADVQEPRLLNAHRGTLKGAALKRALPYTNLPSPEKHAAIVQRLRESSAGYWNLQQLVRILVLFRDWRAIEEDLMTFRKSNSTDEQRKKADMAQAKEILENIESIFAVLIGGFTTAIHSDDSVPKDDRDVLLAYIPEVILAYLSVLQTAAFFLKRDSVGSPVVKAMEIANLVADDEYEWLQELFVKAGRMKELVDALAMVSRAMLRLNQVEPKKSGSKKRGSKGETLRIWDLNARDRV